MFESNRAVFPNQQAIDLTLTNVKQTNGEIATETQDSEECRLVYSNVCFFFTLGTKMDKEAFEISATFICSISHIFWNMLFFFWLNILMFFSFPLLVNLLFLIITCTPGIRVGNKWTVPATD